MRTAYGELTDQKLSVFLSMGNQLADTHKVYLRLHEAILNDGGFGYISNIELNHSVSLKTGLYSIKPCLMSTNQPPKYSLA